MYCNKCGKEIELGQLCDSCESKEINEVKKNAMTYDYKTVEADSKTAMEIADYYESLGWEPVNQNQNYASGKISVSFRRNRKIKNKEQLNRLQVKLDDSIECINVYEKGKTQKATIVAVIVGIIGTLIFGGGMCFCMPDVFAQAPDLWMYIVGGVLGVIGAVVCAFAYLIYLKVSKKSAAAMSVLIDRKREDISQICEEGQKCLV